MVSGQQTELPTTYSKMQNVHYYHKVQFLDFALGVEFQGFSPGSMVFLPVNTVPINTQFKFDP